MLDAIGQLIFEAIQKQIKESQARGGPQSPFAPGTQPFPPGTRTFTLGSVQPPQAVTAAQQASSVAATRASQAPPARPAAPSATDIAGYASLDPSSFGQAASLAAPAPPSNPLLDAFRGGPALLGGIIVAQVLGPPASLKPHSAPGDTL